MLLTAACLAAGLLLAGCTSAPAPGEDAIARDEPTADAEPIPETSPTPQVDGRPALCSEDDTRTITGRVSTQLSAIASEDWATAVDQASPGFRETIDADDFRDIILDGFPVVAAVERHTVGTCSLAEDGEQATLVVMVTAEDGREQTLLYLFDRLEDAGGWGISGALPSREGSPPSEDAPTITA